MKHNETKNFLKTCLIKWYQISFHNLPAKWSVTTWKDVCFQRSIAALIQRLFAWALWSQLFIRQQLQWVQLWKFQTGVTIRSRRHCDLNVWECHRCVSCKEAKKPNQLEARQTQSLTSARMQHQDLTVFVTS